MAKTRTRRKPVQLGLKVEPKTWGGKRRGAGRKPGPVRRTPHLARPLLASRFPVHVTLKVDEALPDLRGEDMYREVEACLAAGKEANGVRLVHYSFQSHHLHLVVEATSTEALTKGIRGLSIRLARRINKLCGRRGQVFVDRYFARILKTPRQVKNCLRYVLLNIRKHALQHGRRLMPGWIDDCSSARFFDGWRDHPPEALDADPPVAAPGTWLLSKGWRRWGLLSTDDIPGPEPSQS